ncbi:glycoside hydrolase family 3 C-terminal domain-containing protein [Candidatus Binatia bacterium]|nr:glycoside hydrolase family 3 C-terminal domain-containing protein [Candidatus Binatia bacterium]
MPAFAIARSIPRPACAVLGAVLALASACGDRTATPPATPAADWCRVDRQEVEARIDTLLPQMSLDEKVAQMHGSGLESGWATSANERLGIPSLQMLDGPRGVSQLSGHATAFPVGMARGATWDLALEEQVGEAMGVELRAKGGSVLLAPTINILRHPAWGRAQETYGEDAYHLGRMGVAFVRGAQRHVIASVKHFAANSIENTRFGVNVTLDERTLREVYLPHFRSVVQEAHVGSVMTAYNKVNGRYCAENAHLVRDILKGEWGFDGFVESDWVLGTRSTVDSALAGLDIEMPSARYYGAPLVAAVENGAVPEDDVDDAVRRIVRAKLCLALDSDPPVKAPDQLETPAHLALARQVEREAIVLLKNERAALPLDRATVRTIAVTGPLADRANIGDTGSSAVNPTSVVTPLAGLLANAGGVAVQHVVGDVSTPENAGTLADADAAVVVVGLTTLDEGENIASAGDRKTLALHAEDEDLIRTVAAANPRTIVVLEGGSAITVESWIDRVAGLVMAWYPGQEGGHAIAEVLFGDVDPSGKLPLSVPRAESDLPEFVSDSARLEVTYGYDHGYRWLDHRGIEPRFPFGFGGSYTSFALANLAIAKPTLGPDDTLQVTVDVTNTGTRAGDEVVQLYVGYPGSAVARDVRTLRAFARVHLAAGETATVPLRVPVRDLAYWDVASGTWVVEPLRYDVNVGTSSRDLPLAGSFTVRGA